MMSRLSLALLVTLFVAVYGSAQELAPVPPMPEPTSNMEVPEGEGPNPGEAFRDRQLNVLAAPRAGVRPNANYAGTNGELLFDAPPSPYAAGVLLRAFAATPSIALKLGTNTISTAAFKIVNSSDQALFVVGGEGYTIMRRDYDGPTVFDITNYNPGGSTPSSRQIRFLEGGTVNGVVASFGSGSTGAVGGPGAMHVWNLANAAMLFATNNTERIRINPDGRVGIGTGVGSGRLTLMTTSDNGTASAAHAWTTVEANITQYDYAGIDQAHETVNAGVTNAGAVTGRHTEALNTGAGLVDYTMGLRAISGIQGGITGSANRAYGLHVLVTSGAGSIANGYGVYIQDTAAVNDYGVYQEGANDTNFFAGSVGIGTTAPYGKLSNYTFNILDAGGIGETGISDVVWSTSGQGYIAAFENRDAGSNARNGVLFKAAATDTNSYIAKFESGGSNRIAVRADGNVGIGTAAPTSKLHVIGNVHATGAITGGSVGATYQDVAEWVPSLDDIAAGTVVVLNPEMTNHVMPSSRAYDSTVAGVVSEQPGLILGVASPSKEMIATTGRVRVRVDATKHAIAIGDLLVTSDKPGMAMKSIPIDLQGIAIHRPGTIVGKALEALAGGEGEILVLLSLQ